MEGVMYQNALMDINRQLHFTILTVWINTWGLNEFILVFCSSEVLTGLNRLKTKQTNKKKKKLHQMNKQNEWNNCICHLYRQYTWLEAQAYLYQEQKLHPRSYFQHCTVTLSPSKRLTEEKRQRPFRHSVLLYKAFLPTDYLIWMLTNYNYQKKNI